MSENPCQISAAAASLFTERARVGVTKYGTTLADAGLDRPRLLRLLAEELADALAYVTALQAAPERQPITREAVTAIVTGSAAMCKRSGGTCLDERPCYCRRTIDALMTLIGDAP